MASRRMFSINIMSSDLFGSLSNDAKLFYVLINMAADDEGFVNNTTSIAKQHLIKSDVISELEKDSRIISFGNGVYLLTEWNLNNKIAKEKKQASVYLKYLDQVTLDETGKYIRKSEALNELRQFKTKYAESV